jgi:hypothetical protein
MTSASVGLVSHRLRGHQLPSDSASEVEEVATLAEAPERDLKAKGGFDRSAVQTRNSVRRRHG